MKQIICFAIISMLLTACTSPATPANLIPDANEQSLINSQSAINAPLIESPALTKIIFLNQRDGWGLTETQVVRTNDGGVTWYNVTPSGVTETGFSADIVAFDAAQVWVQLPDFSNYPNAGFQYHTNDGGISWARSFTAFSGARLSFLDANNGWALADLGVGAGSNAVAVHQTSDAGGTWALKFINDPNHASASGSLPLGGLKFGLTPLNMQTAWIYGVIYASGTAYLHRTDDGGATWAPVSLSLPPNTTDAELGIEQMKFVTASDGYLIMRITAPQGNSTVLYSTNDGGNTWNLLPTLIPGAGVVDFLSASEMIQYNREQFHVTNDAGRTWGPVAPDIKFGDVFVAMDFVDLSNGWVLTQDPANHRSLYRTQDGGFTWFPVIP